MRRTKPRTMWLSKFSSLSRRSKPIALGSLHEAFPDVALVRLRCLDAVPHMHGLAVATAHVLVDLFSMSQAIGQHGVYIREAQRVVRLYDRLGSSATTKSMYHDLKQDPRFAYAIDSWRIFSERNRHGLDRGHVGARRRCHDGTIIAVRHRVRKPPTIVTARGAIDGRRGKTKTAVVELGLQELINADRRRRLGEAFGSQPDLRTVARRRSAPDPR